MLRSFWRYLRYILLGIFLLCLLALAIWWIKSPGEADPIMDGKGRHIAGSISSIDSITLGGHKQYLIIRGHDSSKPVMLFVHGGPGGPEGPMMKELNPAIEKDFVMVYWEQRGAGKSYAPDIAAETMTLSRFVEDANELSKYLIKRFHQEKIYIMGHSWGSLLGMMTAYRYPENYRAYFGVGQIANQYRGELESFKWVKSQARERGDSIAINELETRIFPDSPATNKEWDEFLGVERAYVMKYGGGATHTMTSIMPFVRMVFAAKEYTLREKLNYVKASDYSMRFLWPEVISTNLYREIDSMRVPVIILQGRYDYQTPYPVANDFFMQLKAPSKQFFTFENSAHSPNMEEVGLFNSIVRKAALEYN